jgi:hypothetical protein
MREARRKRKKIRVRGGINFRAYLLATNESPKNKNVAVRAR